MKYEIFVEKFFRNYRQDNQHQRMGQYFMNELSKYDLNLYCSVPADVDPFYNDKLLQSCIEWVSHRWVDT